MSILLDDAAIKAFNELKQNLLNQIELIQPDYSKRFTLTTDAQTQHWERYYHKRANP